MIKVIGGDCRGRTIRAARGRAMRPTASRLRETLFNLIGPSVAGCSFLDLCAGSGSVGIEALSRGADQAVFVDSHATSIALIRRNLADLGLADRALVIRRDAERSLAVLEGRDMTFEAVFLDPPYDSDVVGRCLRSPRWHAIMRGRGRIFVEHERSLALSPPAGWHVADSRRFGETVLTVLRGGPPP